MQGTRPASATGLPPRRRRTKKPDSLTLASVVIASAAVAPITDLSVFGDWKSAREIVGDVIERLLGILDTLDGDPDLEEPGDLEPSLGLHQGVVDAELDTCDNEPSLGWPDRMVNQEHLYSRAPVCDDGLLAWSAV